MAGSVDCRPSALGLRVAFAHYFDDYDQAFGQRGALNSEPHQEARPLPQESRIGGPGASLSVRHDESGLILASKRQCFQQTVQPGLGEWNVDALGWKDSNTYSEGLSSMVELRQLQFA